MPMIKIDNIDYDTDSMSQEAKASLEMLVLAENKLKQLQQEAAFVQTARNAYLNALKAALPSPLQQVQANDTIQF